MTKKQLIQKLKAFPDDIVIGFRRQNVTMIDENIEMETVILPECFKGDGFPSKILVIKVY